MRKLYGIHPFLPPAANAYLCWTKCTACFGVLNTEQISTPLDSLMGRKAWPPIPSPPGYYSPRIINVSPSSHSQMGRAGTLLWWRSINSPGINAQIFLFFYAQVLRAPSHSIYGLDSDRRLSSRKGTRRLHQDNPYP